MKTFLLVLSTIVGQNVFASPHRHLHNHHHGVRHQKREDDGPITTWVTEWVSVVKTVEVTTTLWITPSTPEPTQAIDNEQDFAVQAPTFPSPIPAQFFEPQPSSAIENLHAQNVDPTPVLDSFPIPSITNEKIEPSQSQAESTPVNVDPVPAVDEAMANLSNDNKTASIDHAVMKGPCTSGSPCDGDITYYDPGVGAGACGWQNTKDEPVVALPHALMGEKSNGNPYCGKTITIIHHGKTSTARVVDKCMGCTGFSIDLSNSVFSQLEALSVGRSSAKWWINE